MLNLAGIAVNGVSIGGFETCIQLPGYDLAFDIGRAPRSVVQRSIIAISHAHLDHLGGVAMHIATRSLTDLAPPTYIVPDEVVNDLEDLLRIWRRLDGSRLAVNIISMPPNGTFVLEEGKTELRAFKTIHPVYSLGYGIWSVKKKLKSEYMNLSGQQLCALKFDGVNITEHVWTPDVAYLGDTNIDILDLEPWILDARLLIMETTFLDDCVSVKSSRDRGHVHLDEVIERADSFKNQAILFTHFSSRYSTREVKEIIRTKLPSNLVDRVVPLLPGS